MTNFDPGEKTRLAESSQDLSADPNIDVGLSFPADEPLPTTVGRYSIVKPLGRGGFGAVYLARDAELDRLVAIKVPHGDLSAETLRQYRDEARLVASLDHEHIVPVFDVGQCDQIPIYIVSKYIDGATLRQRIQDRPFDQWESARLIAIIASALHYAHTKGVIHRDVKPGNIMLGVDDKPFLLDFGLALRDGAVSEAILLAGTPAYMSPEQARGEGHRVDGRSDIFSLSVVLYLMLTGQKPFQGQNKTEVLEQIIRRDARPLRQINDRVSRELERICMRAMEKRASDRYSTAKDFADDLEYFLSRNQSAGQRPEMEESFVSTDVGPDFRSGAGGRSSPSAGTETATATETAPIVPRGLRSFGPDDADFFLSLLPGPRDRDGLPDSIRFWKSRIEDFNSEATFSVGLLCGPSGCGKSSLVKAGLLPQLARHVKSVYVESTREGTEARLLAALKRQYPDLGERDLVGSLTAIRQGSITDCDEKLLIVLDQFEQWLHGPQNSEEAELIRALRQCEGSRVQCLLLVRDDFWMSMTRFMKALEIRIVEGRNSATVDLFDRYHAEKILKAFGQAFGRLPTTSSQITPDQQLFLQHSVESLSEDGRVICVHLAVFAEMMKSRPWAVSTLRSVGGSKGLGVTFLEDTFNGASTSPERRFHQQSARAILQCLLPETGSNLKGARRSEDELLKACGYEHRRNDFEDVINILDTSLKLISPTDSPDNDGAFEPAATETEATKNESRARYYQLAHDYLVPSIRDWLNQKQQETRRGRAQLVLSRRAELWKARPESRQLPSLIEWIRISVLTDRPDWSDSQRQMMSAASVVHGRNLALAAVLLAAVLGVLQFGRTLTAQRHRYELAQAGVTALLSADVGEVPQMITDLNRMSVDSTPLLKDRFREASDGSREQLLSSLALLPEDSSQTEFLLEQVEHKSPSEVRLIGDCLAEYNSTCAAVLWERADDSRQSDNARFRTLAVLGRIDSGNSQWSRKAEFVADQLTNISPLSVALEWANTLKPVKAELIDPLSRCFRDLSETPHHRNVAINLLADYAGDDPLELVELIAASDAEHFAVLLPILQPFRETVIDEVRQRMTRSFVGSWPESVIEQAQMPEEFRQTIEAAGGFLAQHSAMVQTLPLSQFHELAKQIRSAGYRPVRLRPFVQGQNILVACVWTRDGLNWEIEDGTTAEALRDQDAQHRTQQMLPVDVSHYRVTSADGAVSDRYAAVWCERRDDINDAGMYVHVTEDQHIAAWQPFISDNFSVQTNLKIQDAAGVDRYSSVRWKLWHQPRVTDVWADHLNDYELKLTVSGTQRDVRVTPQFAGASQMSVYAAVWWDGTEFETQELHGLTPAEQLTQGNELLRNGYRPWSVSVLEVNDALQAASVWARPLDEAGHDRFASEQANLALTQFMLSAEDGLWPLLQHTDDNRLRSLLIDQLSEYNCPSGPLLDRLSQETETSVRRALLLALAEYDSVQFTAADRDELFSAVSVLMHDADPGVRSACELIVQRHLPGRSFEASAQPADASSAGWYVQEEGHTLALIHGPVEFSMGSVPQTQGRDNFRETRHRVRIPRSFAVATREVSIEQFQRFQPDFDFADDLSRHRDCPVNCTSWYDAARYCRWLSEQEGIPEEQMCFPEIADIRPGMTLPKDYLSRTGYRLPTEAEWEYACRAGATTERSFGQTELLIDRYAWTNRNSRRNGVYQLMPVGTLLPNDLGMFDMLGNVMEWCIDPESSYPDPGTQQIVTDAETDLPVNDSRHRPARGGAFLYQPGDARASHRNNSAPPSFGNTPPAPYRGFRIARTLPSDG
ncbi:MAG: SUMF1/EgtB/PvdO family nonheme iron enzyme [Planctomycetaceae bacterium]